MKLTHKLLALLLFATALPSAAQKGKAYDGRLTFDVLNISKAHDTLFVSLKARLEQMKLHSRSALALTPVIVSPDGSQRLPLASTVLGGRNRIIMAQRGQFSALGVDKDTPITRHRNRRDSILVMDYAIPYQPWMRKAQLFVEI